MTEPQRQILRALPRTGSVSLATLATSVHGEATEEQIKKVKAEMVRIWIEGWAWAAARAGQWSLTDAGRAVLDGAAA